MRTLLIAGAIIRFWMILMQSYNETEAIEFKMTNLVCESYNESWFVFHKYRLRAVSRNKTCMYLNATILHPATRVHVRAELFQRANGYKTWLINTTVDICRFLKKPFNPFAVLVYKLFLEFTNFSRMCPLIGPQIVEGFYLKWTTLPHAIPTGEYLLGLTWFFDRRPQFVTNVYFIFTEDLMANH